MPATSLQVALDNLLGDDSLERFVHGRRLGGSSWRSIAADLYDTVGVEVPAETIRQWYGGDVVDEVSP